MRYPYGKNMFLTGGSSGIGLAAAELFASKGYTVYSASRSPAAGARSFPGGGEIRPVALDVRDARSVDAAAEAVLAKADIGILVHCAGVGIACAGEEYAQGEVEDLIGTNLYGVMRVNSRFLPHMRGRGKGLCVIVGSVAGVFPIPYQSHYCASKAALDIYGAALRMELRGFGVRVSLVLPGDTSTGFTGARRYVTDESSPFHGACLRAVRRMERDEISGRPPESAARAIFGLSMRGNPPARKVVGLDYKLLVFLRRLLPDRFVEFALRAVYMRNE